MHKAIGLVAILLCGCESQPLHQFDSIRSDHVREVMTKCAAIIAKAPYPITSPQADWHYQRCLVRNNATI